MEMFICCIGEWESMGWVFEVLVRHDKSLKSQNQMSILFGCDPSYQCTYCGFVSGSHPV